jgi:hypothetical protein
MSSTSILFTHIEHKHNINSFTFTVSILVYFAGFIVKNNGDCWAKTNTLRIGKLDPGVRPSTNRRLQTFLHKQRFQIEPKKMAEATPEW